jgi:hypothetical protein
MSKKIAIFTGKIAIDRGLSLKVMENLELSNRRSHQHPLRHQHQHHRL